MANGVDGGDLRPSVPGLNEPGRNARQTAQLGYIAGRAKDINRAGSVVLGKVKI